MTDDFGDMELDLDPLDMDFSGLIYKPEIWSKVKKAIEDGILIQPNKCSNCGRLCTPVAHHEDYSKPLEVSWLCRACHKIEHPVSPWRNTYSKIPRLR
jgi:ferredoxin